MNVLNKAINDSKIVQQYYDDLVYSENQKYNESININYKFAWVEKLGHSLIDYIDVSIGGELIDRQYGVWIDIWYELCGVKNQSDNYMKMIGNVPSLVSFDRNIKPKYTMFIPLQFWFNRFNGLALPLVALQYDDVTIDVKFRKFSQCAYIENPSDTGNSGPASTTNLDDLFNNSSSSSYGNLEASLLIDYVYLEALERRKFAQSSHEYLINRILYTEFNDIDIEKVRVELDFFHPSRELIWVLRKNSYTVNNDGFTKLYWNNFSNNISGFGHSIVNASLSLNGHTRVDAYNFGYYNYVQPYQCHSNTPSDGIYVYSFALKPEEHQPSGSCNFTRISKTFFDLNINPLMFISDNVNGLESIAKTPVKLMVFSLSTNIIRIMSGKCSLCYNS
jgi:hypothetical protein